MKIALIGAGNLATRLGVALVAGGQSVVQVYSRTEASAAALGKTLHCPAVTSLEQVCRDADVYIVAVKDAAFSGLDAVVRCLCTQPAACPCPYGRAWHPVMVCSILCRPSVSSVRSTFPPYLYL